jgi:hypothetical protein
MENQQLGDELSPEELEARRDEMKEFYEKSIPYLEAQSKYETLLTEVEESRFKRATMQMQYANMMASVQGPEDEEFERPKPTPAYEQPTPEPQKKAPAGKGKKLRKA